MRVYALFEPAYGIGEIQLEKNSSGVRMEKRHSAEEKKSVPVFVKYGLIALAAIAVIVAGVFIFFSLTAGYVATIGNEKIGTKEFKFYLMIQKQSMYQVAYNADQTITEDTFFSTKLSGGKTALEIARDRALESIQYSKIQLAKAKEKKISLTSEETKNIDNSIKSNIINSADYGGGSRIKANTKLMDSYGFGLDDFRKVQIEQAIISKYQESAVKDSSSKITKDQIKDYYDKHPDWYKGDTQMRSGGEEALWARHILIKADKDAAQDVKDAAKKKAQDILDKLKAGADFVTLCKENSEDGNAQDGGDYVFGKGRMVTEFETAAFSLNPGQLYDKLVETQFGYHIIKLDEKYAKDQPVSLKCATEYREFGTNYIGKMLYQDEIEKLKKDTKYKATPNTVVFNSIDAKK